MCSHGVHGVSCGSSDRRIRQILAPAKKRKNINKSVGCVKCTVVKKLKTKVRKFFSPVWQTDNKFNKYNQLRLDEPRSISLRLKLACQIEFLFVRIGDILAFLSFCNKKQFKCEAGTDRTCNLAFCKQTQNFKGKPTENCKLNTI